APLTGGPSWRHGPSLVRVHPRRGAGGVGRHGRAGEHRSGRRQALARGPRRAGPAGTAAPGSGRGHLERNPRSRGRGPGRFHGAEAGRRRARLRGPAAGRGEAARLPRGRRLAGAVVGWAPLVAVGNGARLLRRRRHQRDRGAARAVRTILRRRLQPGARPGGGRAVTPARAGHGLGLVEVLVALGVLAVAVASLLALHAASLRATRAAQVTRHLAVAAESESRLRSLVAAAGAGCLVAVR